MNQVMEYVSQYLRFHLAKSDGTSIEQHIQELLKQLNLFFKRYTDVLTEKEKKLLKVAIQYHDYGKLNKLFQCKLPVKHQVKPVKCSKVRDDKIPHQFISPLFLRKFEKEFSRRELFIIIYSILNHHARGQEKYLRQGYYGVNLLIKEIKENIFNFFHI